MGCSCSNFMRIVLVVGVLDVFEVAVLRPPATTIFGSSPWDVRRLWLQYLRYHLEMVECRIKFKTDLSSHFRSRVKLRPLRRWRRQYRDAVDRQTFIISP